MVTRLLILVGVVLAGAAQAQSRSQSVDYTAYNTSYNGSNWVSYASGYGNIVGTNTSTGDYTLYTTGNAGSAGLIRTLTPAMTVTAAGTVSAVAFVGSGAGLTGVTASAADNITSSTTKVTANSTGYISLTTEGTTTGYMDTSGRLIVPGISATTNQTSVTSLYASGNVGIGISSPVFITSNYSGLQVNSVNGSEIHLTNGVSGSSGSDGLSIQVANAMKDVYIWQRESAPIIIGTNAMERLRIDASGNVGIGTTSPGAALDITRSGGLSNILLDGAGDTYNYSGVSLRQYGTTKQWFISHSQNNPNSLGLNYYNGSSWLAPLVILPSGNVGIGTSSPNAKLEVNGTISTTALTVNGTAITGGSSVPQGTLCGLATNIFTPSEWGGSWTTSSLVSCNGVSVDSSCPSGYTRRTMNFTDHIIYTCSKN